MYVHKKKFFDRRNRSRTVKRKLVFFYVALFSWRLFELSFAHKNIFERDAKNFYIPFRSIFSMTHLSLLFVSRFFFTAMTDSRSWFPIVHNRTYFKRKCVYEETALMRYNATISICEQALYSARIRMMCPSVTWIFNHQRLRLTRYVISWERRRLHFHLVILMLRVKVEHRSRFIERITARRCRKVVVYAHCSPLSVENTRAKWSVLQYTIARRQ